MRTPGPRTTSSSSSTPGPTILSPPPSSGIALTDLDLDGYAALFGVDTGCAEALPDDDTDVDVQDC